MFFTFFPFYKALALAHAPTSAADLPPPSAAAASTRGIGMDSFSDSITTRESLSCIRGDLSAADEIPAPAEGKTALVSLQSLVGGPARERLAFDEMVAVALLDRLKAMRDSCPSSSEESSSFNGSLGDVSGGSSNGSDHGMASIDAARRRGLLRLSPPHLHNELLAAVGPAAVKTADRVVAVLTQSTFETESSPTTPGTLVDDSALILNVGDNQIQVHKNIILKKNLFPLSCFHYWHHS